MKTYVIGALLLSSILHGMLSYYCEEFRLVGLSNSDVMLLQKNIVIQTNRQIVHHFSTCVSMTT